MDHTELTTALDRLAAASAALEHLAARINEADESTITRIVAQVEDRRTLELEAKLADMQQTIAQRDQRIAELEAAAATATDAGCPTSRRDVGSRKTIPTTTATLLAKQGLSIDTLEAGALDAALTGLSLEQRFAIKAQLLRAGVLS